MSWQEAEGQQGRRGERWGERDISPATAFDDGRPLARERGENARGARHLILAHDGPIDGLRDPIEGLA